MPSFPFERIQALESAFGGRQVLEPAHRDGTVLVSPAGAGAESTANKDQPSGYAGLDAGTKLKTAELPASVETDIASGGAKPIDSTGVADGQALVYDIASGKWKPASVSGAVSSVFGRAGAVVAAGGDYTAAQVGAPPTSRQVVAGNGLSGGGDLSADRTLTVVYGSGTNTAAQGNDSRITGAEQVANKNAANGYAGLDASSLLAPAQVPVTVADVLQPGVLGSVASTGITATINSSTRVPTWSQWPTNDVIWFSVSGVMRRGTMPAGPTAAFDAPATGKYRYVAIDAVPGVYGAACTYVESSSADQTTAALAAAAPTSVTAGNVRVWDGIILNTAGAYSLVAGGTGANTIPAATGRDRRSWARGFNAMAQSPTGTSASYSTASTSPVAVDATNLQKRGEFASGVQIVRFNAHVSMSNATVFIGISVDGTVQLNPARINTTSSVDVTIEAVVPLALTGSHLITAVFWADSGTINIRYGTWGGSELRPTLTIEERVRPNASNGTA